MPTAQLPLLDKLLLAATGIYTMGLTAGIAWLFRTRACPDCHGTSHLGGKTCCGCGGTGTLKL